MSDAQHSLTGDEPFSWHALARAEAAARAARASASTRDRALTAERQAWLDHGIHPATRLPLLHPDEISCTPAHRTATCGGCTHLVVGHRGRYFKCQLAGVTHGEATDIRKTWPACQRYEPRNSEVSA